MAPRRRRTADGRPLGGEPPGGEPQGGGPQGGGPQGGGPSERVVIVDDGAPDFVVVDPWEAAEAVADVAEQAARAAGEGVFVAPGPFDEQFRQARIKRAAELLAMNPNAGFDAAWHSETQHLQRSLGQAVNRRTEPATEAERAEVERLRRRFVDGSGAPGGEPSRPSGPRPSPTRPQGEQEPSRRVYERGQNQGPIWTAVDRLDEELQNLKIEDLLRKVGVITGIAAGAGGVGALAVDEVVDPYD